MAGWRAVWSFQHPEQTLGKVSRHAGAELISRANAGVTSRSVLLFKALARVSASISVANPG